MSGPATLKYKYGNCPYNSCYAGYFVNPDSYESFSLISTSSYFNCYQGQGSTISGGMAVGSFSDGTFFTAMSSNDDISVNLNDGCSMRYGVTSGFVVCLHLFLFFILLNNNVALWVASLLIASGVS